MAERRLRVLVISLGRRGGINDYAWLMSRALVAHCDVAAITSGGADNRERWATLSGPHLEVPTFSSVIGLLASFFAFPRFARITRFARGFAPDVIYYPGGHAYKPLLDLLLPRSARVVLTIHDPELHEGEDSSLHRFLDASNRLRVDGYVLLNAAQRADFVSRLKLDPARVAVIPHGVLDHLVAAGSSLADFEGLAQITPFAGQYALFVGRIGRYKGLGLLLSAYNALADPAPFPLIIAGSGALSPQELDLLGELRDQRVVLLNKWLADDEMATLVAAARFVVVPYVAATQSAVIPLASGFGVPSIASDAGGLVEQVLDGETGFLFPAKDGSALRSALERAFSMPDDQYSEMSKACRAFARANWDWDVLAGRLTRFFDAIR